MLTAIRSNPALPGTLSALIAVGCFSVNDVVIKFFSDGYALHQVVLIRAVIGMAFLLLVFRPLSGGWVALRTRKLGWHIARGACVVMANMTFFLGLAAMPLAVIWGLIVFGEWPDGVAMGGICFILGSGLFMIWRETLRGRTSLETPKRR